MLNTMQQDRYDGAVIKAFRRRWAWALALVVAIASAHGCSRSDSAPPVGSITVTLNRTQAASDTPVDFTYRVEVLPGARIEGDYRMFVQIKNADGHIVWSDDHEPPRPTSTWKPGDVVEYTRTAFVPRRVATGDLSIFVGLYSDNRRLPLKGPDGTESKDRSYRVASLQVSPESDRVFIIYKGGWHPEEAPEQSADAWWWTQQSAVLSFENPKSDVTLYLDYDTRPDVFSDGPQTVSLLAGGQVVKTWRADSQERRLQRIPVSAAVLGTGGMSELQIDVDKVFVPANLPAGGKDTRSLGIRVYHAFIDRR
jgi:hypothetical protein